MDELCEPARARIDPERRVAGSDQLLRGVDDVAQQHRQGEIAGDHLVGPQQPAKAALAGDHLVGALDELAEQLVQLQAREIGKGQRRIHARRPTARARAAARHVG